MTLASADAVKALRDRTGAGMMDCKAALLESKGDLEKAIDYLRKKGVASAAKRAGREAKEGVVLVKLNGAKAAIVEANCETDFVAKTDDFKNLAAAALEEAFVSGENAPNAQKISSTVEMLSGKIGEKIMIRRAKLVQSSGGTLFAYTHSNNKLGVVVELSSGKPETAKAAAFQELGKNIAMQIAASSPLAIVRAGVPQAQVDREKEIYKEEIKGKPENIVEKILQGKLSKFYQTVCLTEQAYIKDDKQSVQQIIDAAAKALGDKVEVKSFTRVQLGETLS